MIEERFKVRPPTDVQDEYGIDTRCRQVGCPTSPQVVKAQLFPRIIVGVDHQVTSCTIDPPPERSRADLRRRSL